ncbi:MAG: SGNH/GDSL hydrolase family protein [Clostridia bacterium]|nr:SGNH/GDSL hydrolase family protein [Clostridia bacterium]
MEKKGSKKYAVLRIAAAVIVLTAVFAAAQRLLTPKYYDGVVEGAFVSEYYREEKDHDVIFVGDCEVYENFSPAVLWREFGINSYIRGSAEQYIWQSYYLLEDTFRYETPDVVVFNVQSLQFGESQNEAYNRMSIEGMRWSSSKIGAIRASMLDGESFASYVFPILRYHDRWSDLKSTDFTYFFGSREPVTHNGYYMRADVRPAKDVPDGKPLANYSFSDKSWDYLDRIRLICEKKGAELVLIKAPSLWPYWYDEWDGQVSEYSSEHGLEYINFLSIQDETGIDYDTDTYDGGLHMNLSGAEKLARFMGKYLTEKHGLADRRGEERLSGIWEEKLSRYDAEAARQRNELKDLEPTEEEK